MGDEYGSLLFNIGSLDYADKKLTFTIDVRYPMNQEEKQVEGKSGE